MLYSTYRNVTVYCSVHGFPSVSTTAVVAVAAVD